MSPNDAFSLPEAPPELCFDKNEFVKTSFSVDEFLHQHRNAAGLEAMRDDLGVYLKVLRSAMIELINQDYADFVNLSSNLIGLDQSIGTIQTPLGQLREEVLSVKMSLNDTMLELSKCLEEKRTLRAHLKCVRSATKVRKAMQQMEVLLQSDPVVETHLERAALQYVQIVFDLQFCRDIVEDEDNAKEFGQNKIETLHKKLLGHIETQFLQTVNDTNVDRLERILRIFCTLDECNVAETIFRRRVVAKLLHPIINETALQNSPQGLQGIYNQILQFIEANMVSLLTLTRLRENHFSEVPNAPTTCPVKGFDFLLNSFWAEVEQRLEMHMSSIFAPGNPEQFFQKYQHTMDFLRRFEEIIGTAEGVRRFKEHEQYRSFQTRWNLPVYFQIRFQEIGGALEKACCRSIDANLVRADSPRFIPILAAIQSVRKCWSTGCYLQQLFIRFWKLTLQILSRTAQWIDECAAISKWSTGDATLLEVLVWLYSDVTVLIAELPNLLALIDEQLDENVRAQSHLLQQCFAESRGELQQRLQTIQVRFVQEIVANSAPFVKQVNDIPRLFRKTNRDIPSKACAYVDQMLDAASKFADRYRGNIEPDVLNAVLLQIFCALNQQYFVAVDEVLTSVQKTEESLRRLKNLRERTATAVSPGAAAATPAQATASDQRNGMTDDDKIRLQLQVDVIHWSTAIERLMVPLDQVQRLDELNALVGDSTRIKVTNKV